MGLAIEAVVVAEVSEKCAVEAKTQELLKERLDRFFFQANRNGLFVASSGH